MSFKKIALPLLVISLLFLLPTLVHADLGIGKVDSPITGYNSNVTGLTAFFSNVIKLITLIGGLLAFWNLISAGLRYIMSGSDPKALQEASSSITMSILGLVIIGISFILAAIFGILLFGDPTFILNPRIYGPGVQQPINPGSGASSDR